MPNFVTENNWPNLKVIASLLAGGAITIYLALAPSLGLPMFEQQWMMENVEKVLTGVAAAVTAIMTIVAYFKKPGEGDGIKEVEK